MNSLSRSTRTLCLLTAAAITLAAFISHTAHAAVPDTINYQGRLTDNTPQQNPISATVMMEFSLWSTPAGGSPLWTETQTVQVESGLFNVLLGTATPIPGTVFTGGSTLYLEIGAGGETLTPRQRIASTPFTNVAGSCDESSRLGGLAAAAYQQRIANPCPAGYAVNTVNADGSVTCIQGPAGSQGPPGNTGPPGPTGPAGPSSQPDTGCPGPRIVGVCLRSYDNTQTTTFLQAAQNCAFLGGDICTDSQAWPLAVGFWQNIYLGPNVLQAPHWTAAYADNDSGLWNGANGGTGDNHSATTTYGYACCGGATPANANVPVVTFNNVKTTGIHNKADTLFAGAAAYCAALNSDICSESQTLLLRDVGQLTVASWANSHSDNDASLYNAINGGTNDDPAPANFYGFACCASLRPSDLSCPVSRTAGVCATVVHNVADATFRQAAEACAGAGADICSIAQSAVLRAASALTTPVWTNSHSDNDGSSPSVGVGAMPDNPTLTLSAGYACCLN